MAQLKIRSVMREAYPDKEVDYFHRYDADGNLVETRLTMTETDYFSGAWSRTSTDNGRTWGEWVKQFSDEGGAHRNIIPDNEFGDEFEEEASLFDDFDE